MNWNIKYLPEADKDLDNLSRQQQLLVKKAIKTRFHTCFFIFNS